MRGAKTEEANVKADVNPLASCKPWTREQIAARAAHDIPEGWYVNVGIGIPVLVPKRSASMPI